MTSDPPPAVCDASPVTDEDPWVASAWVAGPFMPFVGAALSARDWCAAVALLACAILAVRAVLR